MSSSLPDKFVAISVESLDSASVKASARVRRASSISADLAPIACVISRSPSPSVFAASIVLLASVSFSALPRAAKPLSIRSSKPSSDAEIALPRSVKAVSNCVNPSRTESLTAPACVDSASSTTV